MNWLLGFFISLWTSLNLNAGDLDLTVAGFGLNTDVTKLTEKYPNSEHHLGKPSKPVDSSVFSSFRGHSKGSIPPAPSGVYWVSFSEEERRDDLYGASFLLKSGEVEEVDLNKRGECAPVRSSIAKQFSSAATSNNWQEEALPHTTYTWSNPTVVVELDCMGYENEVPEVNRVSIKRQ